GSARRCPRRSRPWRRRRPRQRRRSVPRRRRRRRSGSSTGWTSGTRWPRCATWTPARRTARRCWASAWWPGTTAPWTSGACSTTPARTAWRRSPRAASTTRAASSASTTAGASTAAAPASSSPRPPPSAHLCTRTARRAWRRTRAWCRTTSCGSTRGPTASTRTFCRGSARHSSRRSTTPPSSPSTASGTSPTAPLVCSYDVLVENLMDPAHVPYAHKGLMGKLRKKEDLGRVEFDIEGGGPIKMKTKEANVDGFLTEQQENRGYFRYVAPCTFYGSPLPREVAPFAVDDSPLPTEATEEVCMDR
uniref:Vanillate O-demethylase oxygenase-like C-terminal catalytic domain-containing protein n=1 Tax=Aegilops tauschii subsp. strangulata TaxID=200361 RepID=A0A453M5S5_AEGTS